MKFNIREIATKYFGWDISAFLRSRKQNPDSPSACLYKMAGEIDGNRIATYPRFVIYNLSIPKLDNQPTMLNQQQMIFDSSDFSNINKAFGSIIPNYGQNISIGKKITFKEIEYIVVSIQISIADFFNDYSLEQMEYSRERKLHPIGKFTKAHEGKAVPYNIYIKIELKEIN